MAHFVPLAALFVATSGSVCVFKTDNDVREDEKSAAPQLVDVRWGRLVDVYDRDAATGASVRLHADRVVGPSVASDGIDYLFEKNPITQVEKLTILHAAGSAAFDHALAALDASLVAIEPVAEDEGALPPFSAVPRDAALVLRFSQPIDAATVTPETVRIEVGQPPSIPFDARVFADPGDGALVVVDLAISALEAARTSPPIAANLIGLPEAVGDEANVLVRIPTRVDRAAGQFQVLRSRAGQPLDPEKSAASSPANDVLRVMRSIGSRGIASASADGAGDAPLLLGAQPIQVTNIRPDRRIGLGHYFANLTYATPTCALAPEPGDVIQLGSAIFEVVQGAALSGASAAKVHLILLAGAPAAVAPGAGTIAMPYEPSDNDQPPCFVTFDPAPLALPATGVSPGAAVRVRFSEPIAPFTALPLEGIFASTVPAPVAPGQYVVADVEPGMDGQTFELEPLLPWSHVQGAAETYWVHLQGIASFTGLALANPPPPIAFTLDAAAPTARSGGIALRFDTIDEDGNGKPEIRGQFLLDLADGLIQGRPVTRFSALADRSQPMISVMPPIASGVQTPLSPLGAKLMSLYRYCDLGFGSTDEWNFNLDVERMSWAPRNGAVIADVFPQFQMSLTHGARLPDETLGAFSLLPEYPNSGLVATSYDANVLVDPANPVAVVHPKAAGYVINPSQSFVASSGTVMQPWPMNLGPDPASYLYFTSRDTAVRATGGAAGGGIDLEQMKVIGLVPEFGTIAGANNVPSIGLPLLAEFRCYPSDTSIGLNALDISIAVNSSSRPNFRAFSAGGVDSSGMPVVKDPDLETVPSGGFNPGGLGGPPGTPTPPTDNVYYLGQVDFVVRVSRVHTIWFDTGSVAPDYADPLVVPALGVLPAGTSVVLAYRGASALTAGSPAGADATALDAYGDQPANATPPFYDALAQKNPSITFPAPGGQPDASWKDQIGGVDQRRHFQMRITFVGNTATSVTPALDALGVAFAKP